MNITPGSTIIPLLSALLGGSLVLAFTPGASESPREPETAPIHYAHRIAEDAPSAPTRTVAAGAVVSLPDFRSAAHDALDAVVHVRTVERIAPQYGWYDWSGFFRPDPRSGGVQQGSGSGVILSSAGYIVTNHHVIEGADVIEVGLNDNRTLSASLVGSDPTTDIAVLKVEADGLAALEWGDSDAVQVGDWVLAVGNPFDLTSTVTAGIVSAKARDIQLLRPDVDRSLFPVESFIQTDAAVNPGNSGGALVDASGHLIGINTAIASKTGSYAGYAFAVPANLARKVAMDLVEFGAVQRAVLGVNIRPVDEEIAGDLSLPAVAGVLVTGITEDSGAEQAGIRRNDVILSVGGTPTASMPQLLERVNRYRPGQATEVELWRNGARISVPVVLGRRDVLPEEAAASEATVLGCRVQDITGQEGVEVIDAGSDAFKEAGIKAGTIILTVNGTPTPNVEAFVDAMAEGAGGTNRGVLIEGLDENGETQWFALELD